MAQLPPDGEWLIQQIGGTVRLFNCREIPCPECFTVHAGECL